jgi:hypothetical protein
LLGLWLVLIVAAVAGVEVCFKSSGEGLRGKWGRGWGLRVCREMERVTVSREKMARVIASLSANISNTLATH